MERRRHENETRNDFLQLMMALEEKGPGEGLSREEMLAQCVLFLAAAFETTSSTLTFFCVSMAENEQCQEKLREELADFVLNGAEMTWENIHNLKYLEMCLFESMRIYPAVARTDRVCTNPNGTTLSGLRIPYGLNVGIPIAHVHQLPEYWPEPNEFRPERFINGVAPENAYAFLPFGAGPHNCIGERLAMLELRVAIVAIFSRFKVRISKEHTHVSACDIICIAVVN